jgi:2-polyprenyl-3-methyl-5-hydroxy-6-metoxy-1,4-benzoquinol methylase
MISKHSRYTADINLRGVNDTHTLAIGRVPANSRVLDLGVADGSVAAVLKEMGCRVWGVEFEIEAAQEAEKNCEEVVVGDLNTLDLADRLSNREFDVILMLDVLEHLANPAETLRRLKPLVAQGGWGVISLPNVAHVSLRLSLLNGDFNYTDTGLLDRTHLRFYDRAGVDELLEEAGWAMFDLARVTRRLGTTEIQINDPDPDLVAALQSDIEGLTYQFVISVAPLGSPVLELPPVLPAAVAQDELCKALVRIGELDEEVEQLRRRHIPDLVEQLSAIRSNSLVRRGHLKHLLATLQENSERLSNQRQGSSG